MSTFSEDEETSSRPLASKSEGKLNRPSRHVCEFCLKVFSNSMNLKTHKYQHTGDRPYSCNVCDYAATNLTNFQNHMRAKHTKERPYRCVHCEKTFTEYKTWRSHEDTHTAQQMYMCSVCGRTYKHRTSLLGHVRQKHRQDDAAVATVAADANRVFGEVREPRRVLAKRPQVRGARVRPAIKGLTKLRERGREATERSFTPTATAACDGASNSGAAVAVATSAALTASISEESVDTDLLLGTLPEFTESEQNELLALMRHDSGDQGSIDVALPMLDQTVRIETMVDPSGPASWSQLNASPMCAPPSNGFVPTPTCSPKPVVICPTTMDSGGASFGDWLLLLPLTAAARPLTILNPKTQH